MHAGMEPSSNTLRDWPESERPREKLLAHGVHVRDGGDHLEFQPFADVVEPIGGCVLGQAGYPHIDVEQIANGVFVLPPVQTPQNDTGPLPFGSGDGIGQVPENLPGTAGVRLRPSADPWSRQPAAI